MVTSKRERQYAAVVIYELGTVLGRLHRSSTISLLIIFAVNRKTIS